MPTKPPFPDLDADNGNSLDRILSLTDGIFAFSMTLLAVNVNLRALPHDANPAQITESVLELAPDIIVFVTTFLLVALYWQVNRRTFRYIKAYDSAVTWLIILQLLFVAFLPVASGLFDTYTTIPIVIFLYGGTLLAIGILGQLLWRHIISHPDLADDSLTPIVSEYYSFRGYFSMFVYVVMILVGVLEPEYARWVLLTLLVFYPFLNRIFRAWWQRQHPGEYA